MFDPPVTFGSFFFCLFCIVKGCNIIYPVEGKRGRAVFKCESCSNSYNTPQGLNQHKRLYCGGRNPQFICTICSKTFYQKTNLRSHQIVHMKDVLSNMK